MRRKYLVDRRYQVRLILEIVAMVVLATGISAFATYMLASREISSAFFLAHRDTWDLKELLLPVITGTSLVTFLCVSVISSFITLRATHKIVGPRNRIHGAMQEIAMGRLARMGSIRGGDVLKGLDVSINRLVDGLTFYQEELSSAIEELRKVVGEIEPGEMSMEQMRALQDRLGDLERVASFFGRD